MLTRVKVIYACKQALHSGQHRTSSFSSTPRNFITSAVPPQCSKLRSAPHVTSPHFILSRRSFSRFALPPRSPLGSFNMYQTARTQLALSSSAPTRLSQVSPQSLFSLASRSLFNSTQRIVIPGAQPPRTIFQRIRRLILWLLFGGLVVAGGIIGGSLWVGYNLDKFMLFNIAWTGKADIHYYATHERVNNKYTPMFTGDKVADIKLLQTKLIRDLFKIFLAIGPLTTNMNVINENLAEKRIQALRREAQTNPDLAAELTEDVLLELRYSTAINENMLFTLRQQLVYFYFLVVTPSPSHNQSTEALHNKFEELRDLEEEVEEIVLFVDTALDAVIEQTYTSSFDQSHKIKMYPPL